jgi:oxalyl-CoA decarboxylase
MVDMNVGTYEQLDQMNVARPLVKAVFRCHHAKDIPSAINRAYRTAVSGRPGGVYVDMTTPALGEVVNADEAEKLLYDAVDLYTPVKPNDIAVERAVACLMAAKRPAILIGKGAAYAQVEDLLKVMVERYRIPYLPMSMAKGVLPDTGELSAISCRSSVLSGADVMMVVGARLNWLLAFGKGKWNPDMRIVQLDVEPQEIDVNRPIAAPVIGDIAFSLRAIIDRLQNATMNVDTSWVEALHRETENKVAKMTERIENAKSLSPMHHWTALGVIKPILESNPDVIVVNEGANTLDDTRDAVNMSLPRHRIDCATWAIMGMGMGSAIGAAVATGKVVVAIEGDSAFGFSGMDFETACRYQLPIIVIVFNNGGIYNGIGVSLTKTLDPAPTTLNIAARYDKIGEAFGASSYYVQTTDELHTALTDSIALHKPAIINVQLAVDSGKESGHIGYLNPPPLIDITV